MTGIEIREETPDLRPVEFLDDIDDSVLSTGKFIRKEFFKDGVAVILVGIGKSNFDDRVPKWDLYVEVNGEEKILTITGKYVIKLKELFGRPSQWTKKSVWIKAVPGEWDIQGQKKDGFNLEFTKL